MKKIFTTIFTALLLATPAVLANQTASTDCSDWKETYPAHYCKCKYDFNSFRFPIDSTLTDSVWYKGRVSMFTDQGLTAYVYGDCAVKIDIYQSCKAKVPLYAYDVEPNQTCDVDGETLKKKLEENGVSGISSPMYICVYPLEENAEFRFICNSYNVGPESTCEDPFPVIPGMTFVSSHVGDVYELDPNSIPENATATIDWTSEGTCTMEISRGDCYADPEVIEDLLPNDTRTIDATLLNAARYNQEKLYIHFWDNYSVGRIRLNVTDNSTPSNPTGCDNLTAPTTNARLVLAADGMLYIERDGQRYTLTGSKF